MRFVNVITHSTQSEIDEILYSMSLDDAKQIEKIYSMFDFVEYTSKNGFECMFCIVDENDLLALSKSYNKFDIKHDFFDLTKKSGEKVHFYFFLQIPQILLQNQQQVRILFFFVILDEF